jgi:pilus assembly protein CpaB
MNRTRTLLLAASALVLSVAVTFGAFTVLRNRLQPHEPDKIVVAAQNISLGTRLTAADLKLEPWAGAPIEGSSLKIEDVLNRGVIVPMIANEPVLESKLAAKDGGAGLAAVIRGGMRAVAVKVNEVIGVAGFVLPGTRVDVILSGSPDHGRDTEIAKTIIENVEVLASGKNTARDAEGKPLDSQVVTLLVTPQDSQKLALASADGTIQLALRNPLDIAVTNPAAVSRVGLYGKPDPQSSVPQAPAPVRAPAPRPLIAQAPVPPKAAESAPAPKPQIDVQLIQGINVQKFSFEQKTQ